MQINQANLRTLYTAFRGNFQSGFGAAASLYQQIATVVPSSTAAEEYGWLGQIPKMREWLGDRVVHGITSHGYTVKNKSFELTIGVPRPAIEDDQYGVYSPLFTEMGRSAAALPDEVVLGLLAAGRTELCYDKTPFFGATHPVLNDKGKLVTQSNLDDDGGGGSSWFVLDTSRALKPLIWQNRKAPNFVAKASETDDNVFDKAEFKYGIDSRGNAGYGFWQFAQASNKTLTAANVEAQITAISARKGDHGRPLGLNANVIVVPPQFEFAATRLFTSEMLAVAGGTESNPLRNRLKVVVAPWLA